MIKAIVFDYGGVLAFPGDFDILKNTYSKLFGIPVDTFYPIFRKNWNLWKTDKLNEVQFWEENSKEFGFDYDFEQVKEILRNINTLNEEIVPLIKGLRTNYKVYILSNQTREWLGDEIKRFNFNELFDDIFASYDAKSAKPGKEIYLKFLEKFNLKADECVFIDDKKENVDTARELGFKGIIFTSLEQLKLDLKKLDVEV